MTTTRLSNQLHRLYATSGPHAEAGGAGRCVEPAGPVRGLVLQLSRPAEWAAIARVWQGVQSDLGLPAAAIAVNGVDGYQLWFSLGSAVPRPQALRFLQGLCERYLAGVRADRIACAALAHAPAIDDPQPGSAPWVVPARTTSATGDDAWSAYVAPDLAPVFEDTPWLDLAPSEEGQADLLARFASADAAGFEQACILLAGAGPSEATVSASARQVTAPDVAAASPGTEPDDPRAFLLRVMRDERIDLALRIEAAKALLPGTRGHP